MTDSHKQRITEARARVSRLRERIADAPRTGAKRQALQSRLNIAVNEALRAEAGG